jgi:hypothetical protein
MLPTAVQANVKPIPNIMAFSTLDVAKSHNEIVELIISVIDRPPFLQYNL